MKNATVRETLLVVRAQNIIRRIRWRRLVLITLVVWLLCEGILICAIHVYGQTNHAQSSNVIILLGPPLERRVAQTLDLWRQGLAPYVLCTGGAYEHLPSLTQARDCYQQLVRLGVPADVIVLENVSLSTEENAIYARDLMTEHGWETAILVSDATHLLRAQWLFSRYGMVTSASPASFSDGYWQALWREVIAFHWHMVKDIFRLPMTHISGV